MAAFFLSFSISFYLAGGIFTPSRLYVLCLGKAVKAALLRLKAAAAAASFPRPQTS
jgi:hypothetical protein